jgi:predicted nuclease of predicted toxin-antitoxin system
MNGQTLTFFFDSHLTKKMVEQLRQRGVDAVHCVEVGMSEAPVVELLGYAIEHERAIVSVDADFLRMDATDMRHTGIFRVSPRQQNNIGLVVTELYDYYELIKTEAGTLEHDIQNQVIWIG